ncbi:MAG: hypothetical protein RIC55_12610 [Pirellulaceae bacterium]
MPLIELAGGARVTPRRSDMAALLQIVAACAEVLLLAMAVLFALRRMTGGAVDPLAPLVLPLVGLVLVGVASLLRTAWIVVPAPRGESALAAVGLVAPLPALLLFAAALSMPGAAVWSIILLWLVVLGHETAWGVLWLRGRGMRARGFRRADSPRGHGNSPGGAAAADVDSPAVSQEEPLPSGVSQRIERSSAADGTQHIVGALRADFAARERTQSLHVAFCPPLLETPSLDCQQSDGPPARVTISEVQSYGARIDVRLSRASDDPTSIAVRFFARGR